MLFLIHGHGVVGNGRCTSFPRRENNSVIRNSDHHTNEKVSNLCMPPCSVELHDILDFNDTEQHCLIFKCRTTNCKTSNILITETHFTSNLTNKNLLYKKLR